MNITVYCGANLGRETEYRTTASRVGKWIADHQHTLVYGGSGVGLMKVVADTVLQGGGNVIGVMPEFLTEREPVHPGLTQIIFVEDMSERKKKMAALGDVYLALPGGPGTLEEITEVISWARIGKNNNPCILFNENQYYAPLDLMYEKMVTEGFLDREEKEKILFSDDLLEIEAFISNYQPPRLRGYR